MNTIETMEPVPGADSYFRRDKDGLILRDASSWLGTPFSPNGNVKGTGVDCVHLVSSIYIALGFIHGIEIGKNDMDWGSHSDTSNLERKIWQSGKFQRVLEFIGGMHRDVSPIQNGDLITFRIGRSAHHCGLAVLPKTFIHVYQGQKVHFASYIDPTWLTRISCVYRPIPNKAS